MRTKHAPFPRIVGAHGRNDIGYADSAESGTVDSVTVCCATRHRHFLAFVFLRQTNLVRKTFLVLTIMFVLKTSPMRKTILVRMPILVLKTIVVRKTTLVLMTSLDLMTILGRKTIIERKTILVASRGHPLSSS